MRDDNVVENEVVRRLEWLEKLKVDFAEKVAVAVEAFVAGGPDLEAELDRQAGELPQEIVAECKAANARLWKKAKADHHQTPSWRRVVDPGRRGPRLTQNAVGPSIEAALKVPGKADFASGLEEAIKCNEANTAKPETVEAPPIEPDPKPKTEQKAEPIRAGLPALIPPQPPPATWDDLLTAMNNQHAIIDNVGGKTVIASWEPSSLDPTRRRWVFQNKDSFLLRYSNRYATIEITTKRGGIVQTQVPLSGWWLTHRHRQQYRGITFQPDAPKVVDDCLNLWQDWGCQAKEGNWSLIRDHIETVLAGGNAEFSEYLIRWIAWSIQNQARRPKSH